MQQFSKTIFSRDLKMFKSDKNYYSREGYALAVTISVVSIMTTTIDYDASALCIAVFINLLLSCFLCHIWSKQIFNIKPKIAPPKTTGIAIFFVVVLNLLSIHYATAVLFYDESVAVTIAMAIVMLYPIVVTAVTIMGYRRGKYVVKVATALKNQIDCGILPDLTVTYSIEEIEYVDGKIIVTM